MPHPTPYSRQFDAIRSAFPGLFERPGSEAPPVARGGSSGAMTDHRSGCKQRKPDTR
ncbi:MAG: hypothetical protein JWQ94_4371 [Tardiphaga sp.]|jgi:hypothetical protein|nr:hypothetical protein [Tardiphaga sp.]